MNGFGSPGPLFLTQADAERHLQSVALGRPVRRPSSKPKSASSTSSFSSATDLLELMNSSVLDSINDKVSSATSGRLDVRLFIAACLGAKAAANTVPSVIEMVFDQVKTNVSSSLVVSQNDPVLYKGLQHLAQDKAEASGKAWYNFSGQHGVQLANGDIGNLPGKSQKFLRHDDTLFILEVDEHNAPLHPQQPPTSQMIVRCFGHSNAPIRALFDHVTKQHRESQELTVWKMVAGAEDVRTTSNKRPLSTIDLDPKLKDYITRDAEMFFGEDSPGFYESTGQPYRRGYLLYGPPGTGKTSVSKAIASHFNLPLILITLKGMGDKDLMDAFTRLPYRCVVLLEDIDCAGADVDNRDAQPATGSEKGKEQVKSLSDPGETEAAKKAILKAVKKQQAIDQKEIMEDMDDLKHFVSRELGLPPPREKRKVTRVVDPNQKVSLSGLLNVIDGADAAEGRLLIMTTNCPEKLDKALLRPGRCDEKFKIDYATKITARLTYQRIFSLDEQTPYKPATIDRFADAFVAQFPSNSKISTAELAKYLGQYRGRPQKAIEDFAEWTKRGIDLFAYRVDELASNVADGEYNVPEAYELSLLNVGPEDLVDVKPSSKSKSKSKSQVEKPVQSSSWNPLRWLRTPQADNYSSLALELKDLPNKPEKEPSFLQGFIKDQAKMDAPAGPDFEDFRQPSRQAQAIDFYQSLGLVTQKDGAARKQYSEFGDEAFELDALENELRAISPRPIENPSSSTSPEKSSASPATTEDSPASPQVSLDNALPPSQGIASEDSSAFPNASSSGASPTSSGFSSAEFHSAEKAS